MRALERCFAAACFAWLAACGSVRVDTGAQYAGLAEAIATRVAQHRGVTVGLVFMDPESGYALGIGDTIRMHAASTMKVPVLIELFKQADQRRFALRDSIPIRNEFRSIADSSKYALSLDDDSDSTLYSLIGRKAAISQLARLMIIRSSNLATNLLIDLVTPAAVRKTLAQAGVRGMDVQRGVEDTPAFRRGMNNTTTAAGLGGTFELILNCRELKKSSCNEMLSILSGQEFNDMIPSGLPPGTRVAHKTGSITGIRHDGGIVFRPSGEPYILVILTRGFEKPAEADRLGADISRLVWAAATR